MPVRLFKTPRLVQALLPGFTWRVPQQEKVIYLTFDDGPIPEVTEFVLAQLQIHEAQATFFCVGDNLQKYPHLACQVAAAGHRLANHTFNHLRGWKTPAPVYEANVQRCEEALQKVAPIKKNKIFRPPYGSLTPVQYKLLKSDYQLIMWDVLTYDFDAELPAEVCLQRALQNTQPGSIVVFHDSLKARRNLEYVLPLYLARFGNAGFRFEPL